MKYFIITIVFLITVPCFSADLNVVPELLDTGVSNITTAFTISSTNSSPVLWSTTSEYGTNPNWFYLEITNGIVETGFDSVPVIIRRDRIPTIGSFTGSIYIAGGDFAKTVTVITAIASSTNNNGMFPKISGNNHAYAGVPYKLDASGSLGWNSNLFWVINYDPSIPIENQAISSSIIDTKIFDEPDEIDLSLVSRDPHGRESVNSIHKFIIHNSPPSILLSPPQVNLNNNSIKIIAYGSDPNPNEILQYRWKFVRDGTWSDWTSSPTGTHTYASAYEGLVWCEVKDTWTNNSLKAEGIVEVSMTTNIPTVLVAYSNSVWSSFAKNHVVTLQKLGENIALKADFSNANSIEWRENLANPLPNLIPENSFTNQQIFITGLTNSGTYAFMIVAINSNQVSHEAKITINVPGVFAHIVADGFQTPVPVWGVNSSTHAANTNAYGIHDDTTILSDIDGLLFLDRPENENCFVEFERSRSEGELKDYYFSTIFSSKYNSHKTFLFPVTKYAYAGRLVDGNDYSKGIPYASATLLINAIRLPNFCNSEGGYSFGALPKIWPIDDIEKSYYVVFIRDGWNSFCRMIPPSNFNANSINDVWELPKTNETIALSGTVKSSKSFLPVANATVWFGDRKAIADENGYFEFEALPKPFHPISSWPTHVLIAEADGYTSTRNIFTDTENGGNIDVLIDGGEVLLYGSIYDGLNGTILTNGKVTTPSGTLAAKMKNKNNKSDYQLSTDISKSGFFSIKVPGGCNYATIELNGLTQTIPINRKQTGTQPVRNDIEFIPEPSSLLIFLFPFLFFRKNIPENKIKT